LVVKFIWDAAIESLSVSSLGVIASSAPKGGGEEDLPTDPDPYNRPNNLAVYSFESREGDNHYNLLNDRRNLMQFLPLIVQYLNRHVRQWGEEGNKLYKFYSVSNVSIDPLR